MEKVPSGCMGGEMRQELKEILSQVFVGLTIFLIAMLAYKGSNPYAYSGIETNVLFILVPMGVILLYLYLREGGNCLSSRINTVIGEVYYRRYMRFCQRIWQTINPLISYSFLGLLLILALQSIAPEPLLEWGRTPLTVAVVALGAVTFYMNRYKLDEIGEEARQEEMEEKKREGEFARKYPEINRVWGVRWVVRWMYKEGWWYSGGMILLVFVAFSIRVYNLTILYPYTDEYIHLIAAKSLLETGSTDYTRAYFLTYIVYLLFKIFDPNLFVARLPGVFFGAITVVPIYLLIKSVSKKPAIISSWLWTISPWAIGVSRNIREYPIFLFFIIFYLIFLIYYVTRVIKIINSEIKITVKEAPLVFILFLPIIYAFYFDPLSSFKQVLLIVLSVGLYAIYMLNKIKSLVIKKYIFYIDIIIAIFGVFLLFQLKNIGFIYLKPQFNMYWLRIFFDPNVGSPMNWYYNMQLSPIFILFIILLGIFYVISTKNKNIIGILMVLIFLVGIYFFTFHFDRYTRPRYSFYLLPFFIFLIGFGIFSIYKLTPNLKFKNIVLAVSILLLFNPVNAYLAITYDKHGYVPMTNENHDDITALIEVYNDNIKKDDVVITSIPSILEWYFDRPMNDTNTYYWDYKSDDRFKKISNVVSKNKNGWIILDWRRNGRWTEGLPRNDFEIEKGQKIKYVGNYRGVDIYRWNL